MVGYDISARRVAEFETARSHGELTLEELRTSPLIITCDATAIAQSRVFIATVPTPVDIDKRPDSNAVHAACAIVGKHLGKGAV